VSRQDIIKKLGTLRDKVSTTNYSRDYLKLWGIGTSTRTRNDLEIIDFWLSDLQTEERFQQLIEYRFIILIMSDANRLWKYLNNYYKKQ